MWMPAQPRAAPLRTARARAGTSSPDGREDDHAVELDRRHVVPAAGPHRAELERELPARLAARVDIDLVADVTRDLDHDVGGRAEPVEAEPSGRSRPSTSASRSDR